MNPPPDPDAAATPLEAEIHAQAGGLHLRLNGRPVSRAMARNVAPGAMAVEKLVYEYLETGIDLFFVDPEVLWTICWDGEDGYDYARYEHHLDRLLDVKPDMKMILYVGIGHGVPYRWARRHTDQLALLNTGDPIKMPSMASKIWRRDFDEALGRFVHHFERSRFADAIIGYNPIRNANEWFGYDMTRRGKAVDFSQPMREHFRDWLRERYGGEVGKLRRFWKDASVTFETAEPPALEERSGLQHGGVFVVEGPTGYRTRDWYLCYNQANTRDAIACCRAVKLALQQIGRRKIVGVMHGYLSSHENSWPAEFGHLMGHEAIRSEWIDFLQGPHSYHNRRVGTGTHLSKFAHDSVLAAGKYYIDQFDFQTHHHPRGAHDAKHVSLDEAVWVMLRGLGFALQHNVAYYWHEGGPGSYDQASVFGPAEWGRLHYDHPRYTQTIRQIKRITDENQRLGTTSAAEIALVHSTEALASLTPDRTRMFSLFNHGVRSWFRQYSGFPVDEYQTELWPDIPRPYRLYLFTMPWQITAAEREAIHRRLRSENAIAVWTYAPGFLGDDGPDLAHCEALTGFRLGRVRAYDEPQHVQVDVPSVVDVAGGDHPFVAAGSASYGTMTDPEIFNFGCGWWQWPADQRFGDVFYAEPDPAMTVLGTLKHQGKPGLCLRRHAGFTSVYTAAPLISGELLRALFLRAGAHCYAPDGDLVYASDRYVTIHATAAGPRRVCLPRPRAVSDAVTDERLGEAIDRLTLEMRFGETRVLRLD